MNDLPMPKNDESDEGNFQPVDFVEVFYDTVVCSHLVISDPSPVCASVPRCCAAGI